MSGLCRAQTQTSCTGHYLHDVAGEVQGAEVVLWAVGLQGARCYTLDSGITWVQQTTATANYQNMWAVDWFSSGVLWAAGDSGNIENFVSAPPPPSPPPPSPPPPPPPPVRC